MSVSTLPVPASIVTVLPPESVAGGAGARRARAIVPLERPRPVREEAQRRFVRPGPRENERRAARADSTAARLPAARPRFAFVHDGAARPSARFLVQALSQDLGAPRPALAEHRDGAVLGADAYRRAGAEPALYSEQPTVFRISA